MSIHCSYCYAPLDRVRLCGKCNARPYCSQECQRVDWNQHKIWCGKIANPIIDFEIRDTGGERGMGLFALRDFEVGEKILVERPVILTETATSDDGISMFAHIAEQFKKASLSIQDAIMALHSVDPNNPMESAHVQCFGECIRKFACNNFGTYTGGTESALCVTASRLNHECVPNCSRYFVPDHNLLVISAGKPISKGQELTISYTSQGIADGLHKFRERTMRAWGFECGCAVCTNKDLFGKLQWLQQMDERVLELGRVGKAARVCKLCERMLKVVDELGGLPGVKQHIYYDMFQMAIGIRGKVKDATRYAETGLEEWQHMIGGSKTEPSEVKKAQRYAEAPGSHPNYLIFS